MNKDIPRLFKASEIVEQYKKHEKELQLLCKVKGDSIVFNVGSEYNIPLKSCDTPKKILEWVDHLCEKTWITPDLISMFICLATSSHKIDLHEGA